MDTTPFAVQKIFLFPLFQNRLFLPLFQNVIFSFFLQSRKPLAKKTVFFVFCKVIFLTVLEKTFFVRVFATPGDRLL